MTQEQGLQFENLVHEARIPIPKCAELGAILGHPETTFKWFGNTLLIANKNFPAMAARFKVMPVGDALRVKEEDL